MKIILTKSIKMIKNYIFILNTMKNIVRKEFIILIFLSLLGTGIPIVVLFLNKEILNFITYSRENKNAYIYIFIILSILTLMNIISHISDCYKNYISSLSANKVSKNLTHKIQRKASELNLKHFDIPMFYDKLENAKRIVGRKWDLILIMPIDVITKIIALITLAGILASFQPILIPVLILGVTPNIFVQIKNRKREIKFYSSQISETRKIIYTENLLTDKQYSKELRIFGLSDFILNMSQNLFIKQFEQIKEIKKISLKLNTFWGIVSLLTQFATILYITYNTIIGHINIGTWQLYVSTAFAIHSNINSIFNILAMSYEEELYVDVLMDFLSIEPEFNVSEGLNYQKKEHPPLIEFRNVSFKYPETNNLVLKSINFKIYPGEKIALVGLNGSGKTTIIKLLVRLYDPSEGLILFDDIDIKKYKPLDIYKLFSILFQDYSKYAFTLRDNISISNIENKDNVKNILIAANEAGCDIIAEKLPYGYDTYLSKLFNNYGYSDLSGGDWQKIAIARGFFRNSPIIIMDEPTSALDPVAEHEMFRKLIKLSEKRTTVFISHRLSSVQAADRIFFLKDGYIAEEGCHKELMKKKSEYARLFDMQANFYKTNSHAEQSSTRETNYELSSKK